jgi:hypothetical protein
MAQFLISLIAWSREGFSWDLESLQGMKKIHSLDLTVIVFNTFHRSSAFQRATSLNGKQEINENINFYNSIFSSSSSSSVTLVSYSLHWSNFISSTDSLLLIV